METSNITVELVADCIARFREARPHVHCITNSVAQHFTANVLLAAGAKASMTIAAAEVQDFVAMADALLINLGTMDAERQEAAGLAAQRALALNKPWALDPVFVHASPLRLEFARKLLVQNPTLVRCNSDEFEVLFGTEAAHIESFEPPAGSTIALTGQHDRVIDRSGFSTIANGHHLMDRITTMGCALSALAIGFCAIEPHTRLASVSALGLFALAGEHAGQNSAGPGTFVPRFLDGLANLTSEQIIRETRLT